MNTSTMTKVLLCAALAMGAGAQAKNNNGKGNSGNTAQQNSGPSIGAASADDVTLENADAGMIAFSTVNPMQYGGNTAGFSSEFGKADTSAWGVLGTVEKSGTLADASTLFDFSFDKTSATSGTWTITNTSSTLNATLDLTVAIHAANASTAFLFDNQDVAAGQTLSGTWSIEWLNNGGQVPGFSNLVFFGRDISTSTPTLLPVPEPHALPMTLAGFAVLGAVAWRRRGKRA
ncbi:PEP-CTERM sorting domain-containing protein [Massilia sp. METH4]|uniref:PEP-CTERM sorting domain-containing protein n=1 Tax=Massilia sp. METH4 TaxID=3123041 RepID=UPI0030D467B9